MRLRCSSFDDFRQEVKNGNKEIVMFGAGVLGRITMPQILKKHQLLTFVKCYLDNNESKWGSEIDLFGRKVLVKSPECLVECGDNTIILLNVSRYADVLHQLREMDGTEDMDCYITAMMCIYNFCSDTSGGSPIFLDRPIIPKKLHYMWLGRRPIPNMLLKCMDSWKRFCPDYEIIEWNEDNYDVDRHPYMSQAYHAGAYGFVPDYARLDILYHEGGFYLDTDVEIRRSIEPLRYQEAFCGVEKWQVINFGGLSGAAKGNQMIKKFLDERQGIYYIDTRGRQNKNTCGFYDTMVALEAGYVIDGTTQNIGGMNIYASDYFQPYDYMSGTMNITEHTYSVHWYNGGWLDEKMRKANAESARSYMALYDEALANGRNKADDE